MVVARVLVFVLVPVPSPLAGRCDNCSSLTGFS